jgi:hypothetical protein
MGMSHSLLRRLGAFITRESGLEHSKWRLRAFSEKAGELLAQVNAAIVRPRNSFSTCWRSSLTILLTGPAP